MEHGEQFLQGYWRSRQLSCLETELASDGGWIEVVKVDQEFVRMNDIDAMRFAGFGRKVF